ncbi:MAG: hypothetical protein PHY93_17480 [Bacteriovorax sp.]|nr:hypothetical protein [Bacteriovorax sp.]
MKLHLLFSVLFATASVFAADAPKVETPKQAPIQLAGYNFAGLALGIARPTGSNSGSIPLRFAYGLEYGHALSKEFAVGGFASRNNGPIAAGSIIDFAITRVGAQAIYNPLHDLFIDLRAGLGFLDASANIGNSIILKSDTTHQFFFGPGVGLIVPVVEKIVFSPSIRYSYFLGNSDSNHFGLIELAGAFRYQF